MHRIMSRVYNKTFFFKVNTGSADINNREFCMNEPIFKFDNTLSTARHLISQKRLAVGSLTDPQIDNNKITHRYIIKNKSIVYEKYDHHGKLISRVPWSAQPIDEKA